MKEIFALAIILVVAYSAALSQTVGVASNSTANAARQSGYSESKPYQPVVFKDRNGKLKKERKSKNTAPLIGSRQAADELITIPISVFDSGGKFARGLQKSNFAVFVDDEQQEIIDFENAEQPINLIFLIDTSPSTESRIEEIRNYVLSIIERLRPPDKAMIAEFNDKMKITAALTDDRQKISRAVNAVKLGGGTSLYDAVEILFQKHINQMQGRKALILLTDGVDTTSTDSSYEKSLIEAEKSGTPVFPIYFDTHEQNAKTVIKRPPFIGLGSVVPALVPGLNKADYDLGRQYLNNLVSLSGGRAITVQNAADAQKALSSFVAEEIRLKYYLKIKASDITPAIGRKQIKIRIDRPGLFILARGSYVADAEK